VIAPGLLEADVGRCACTSVRANKLLKNKACKDLRGIELWRLATELAGFSADIAGPGKVNDQANGHGAVATPVTTLRVQTLT